MKWLPVLNANALKILGTFLMGAVLCAVVGFALGFSYGTGQSVATLIKPKESIPVPTTIVANSLDTVTTVLDEQPKVAYQEGYNCVDFAWSAMRALQWKGQMSAIVRLGFEDGSGHTVLVVPTSDKGYQFIEPQTGQVIHPEVGAKYNNMTVANMTILEFTWQPFDIFLLDPNYGLHGWDDPK